MVTWPHGGADQVFRDYVTGSSGPLHDPEKSEIRALLGQVEDSVDWQPVTPMEYGAAGDGVTNDTTEFEAMVTALAVAGVRYAQVPAGTYLLDSDAQIADVILVGAGELSGPAFDAVHSPFEGTRSIPSGIVPERHLRAFSTAAAPVVVIAGDSIATDTPTTTADEIDSLWGSLQRALVSQSPSTTITFYNRAIGAATWTSLNAATLASTGLTLPSWATGDAGAQPWLDYIETLAPDLVFLAFGMNDRENFGTQQVRAALATINAWAKVPDIVFITPMVPSRMTANSNLSSFDAQNGRHFVAGYLRSKARYDGYGLIDLHRQYCITREGFDPDASSFLRSHVSTSFSLPKTETTYCQDFVFKFQFSATAGFWTGRRLRVDLSPRYANSESWVEIYDNAGNMACEFVEIDDGPGRYLQVTSAIATDTSGTRTITVGLKGSEIRIEYEGSVIYAGKVRRHGGLFQPRVEWTDASSTALSIEFWYGVFARYMPQLTDAEMWGDGTVVSGNDQNHPTSLGAALVYSQTIDAQDLRRMAGVVPGFIKSAGVIPNMADDSTYSLTPPFTSGTFHLWSATTGVGAKVDYNSSAPAVLFSQVGSQTNIAAAGTDLTGTTGTDGKFTVSVKSGSIEIENRRGVTASGLRYRFDGGL